MIIGRRAQSTLEYVLVIVVILLAMIAAIGPKKGPIRKGLGKYLNQVGDNISGVVDNALK